MTLTWDSAPFLKSFALIVIVLRAGLGITRATLARTGSTPFLMAFIPALLEGLALTGAFRLAFALPWLSCATAAALLAAVSPAVIAVGLLFRSLGVLAATGFSRLTRKERLFCVAAYLPKATVQAAMASVPLAYGVAGGEIMLTVAVLSIVVTSPLGLFLVRRLGPRLLEVEFPDEVEPLTA